MGLDTVHADSGQRGTGDKMGMDRDKGYKACAGPSPSGNSRKQFGRRCSKSYSTFMPAGQQPNSLKYYTKKGGVSHH